MVLLNMIQGISFQKIIPDNKTRAAMLGNRTNTAKLTSFLGLWGLNFLEVLLEWGVCYYVYKLLIKDINKNVVLLGILISLMICHSC